MKSYPEEAPADAFKAAFEKEGQTDYIRRLRFTDQIPAVVVTAALVVGAIVWMQHDDAIRRATDLEPLRSETEALRVQSDENRQQLEATNKLLRDAIARNDGEVFRSDEELQKLNGERIDLLADAIVKKVVPALPAPISAAEGAQMQADQVDKVAARLSDNLKPILSELSANQKATSAEVVRQYQDRVQQLNTDLAATQSAAQDALKLTHQVSALYLDSFKDQGVLVRLLSLPSDIVIDTAKLNLITSRDRAKVEKDLSAKMSELDQRLDSIKTATDATKG